MKPVLFQTQATARLSLCDHFFSRNNFSSKGHRTINHLNEGDGNMAGGAYFAAMVRRSWLVTTAAAACRGRSLAAHAGDGVVVGRDGSGQHIQDTMRAKGDRQ